MNLGFLRELHTIGTLVLYDNTSHQSVHEANWDPLLIKRGNVLDDLLAEGRDQEKNKGAEMHGMTGTILLLIDMWTWTTYHRSDQNGR